MISSTKGRSLRGHALGNRIALSLRARPLSIRRGLVATLCASALVAGCNGGGDSPLLKGTTGTGSTPALGSGPAQNGGSISLSTNGVTQAATTSEPAPTALLQIVVTDPPTEIFANETNTTNGISSVTIAGISQTTANVVIEFKSPAQLGPGIYNDTITIYVCNDSQCSSPLRNSPQQVVVQYTVTR